MGYARTKLEEATERVKELELERDALKARLEAAQDELKANKDALNTANSTLFDNGLIGVLPQSPDEYRELREENEQLKKACVDALETLEEFSRSNSWGERLILEPSIDRLSVLVREGKP